MGPDPDALSWPWMINLNDVINSIRPLAQSRIRKGVTVSFNPPIRWEPPMDFRRCQPSGDPGFARRVRFARGPERGRIMGDRSRILSLSESVARKWGVKVHVPDRSISTSRLKECQPPGFLEFLMTVRPATSRAHRVAREDEEVEVALGFAMVNRLGGFCVERWVGAKNRLFSEDTIQQSTRHVHAFQAAGDPRRYAKPDWERGPKPSFISRKT